MNLTPDLNKQRRAGLADAAASYNATAKAAHDERESAREPEMGREPYVPLTDEEYGQIRVGGMLDSYHAQMLERRAALPENRAAILKLVEDDALALAKLAEAKAVKG